MSLGRRPFDGRNAHPFARGPIWEHVRLPTDIWRPAEYDFRTGIPDASLFPYQSWRRLMNCAFDRWGSGMARTDIPAVILHSARPSRGTSAPRVGS